MALEALKIRVPRFVVATVIVVSAIGLPAYFLIDEKITEPSAMQWFIIFLYTIIVILFVLIGVGVKGVNVTSEETDKMLVKKKAAFDRAVKPYVLAIFAGVLFWVAYSIVGLLKNA